MGDRYHNNHAYDHDPYYDHPAEPGRFHSSGDLSGSGSGSGGSYIDPRDRDLEAGDGYSVPDDLDEKSQTASYRSGKRGAGGKDGLGSLARLVEALDRYDDPHTDDYTDDSSVATELLGKGQKGRGKRGRGKMDSLMSSSYDASDYTGSGILSTYPTSEMNPKLRGKEVPKLEGEDEEEVYVAPPFHYDSPEVLTDLERAEMGEDDATEAPVIEKKFKRKFKVNLTGLFVFLLYHAALGFYLWVRITKTLGLGPYTAYGIVILVLEIFGATTTSIYGMNLCADPVHELLRYDEDNPGLTKVEHMYHVRVLIPCYKESLELVGKVVQALYNGLLPDGVARTIYLCDDGKDPKKRKWCEQMGPEIIYVSGRTRQPGEMNGKSCNLNNCLNQIYPPGVRIPKTELVAIFDADQVANIDFYLKTVPLFDAGDDVGMVLSPQCFHNLYVGADIFNHGNINFWEYAQHGYDVYGFISCTGTNFLIRSNAYQQAGWTPTYTLTEDYALGMELKRHKWHCRYVEEYLAIGEAPEQIRNCFQQRSRWCKGHFQIVMSSEHTPFFMEGLSFFQRFMYLTGVWAYIVGALTTPMFIVIPLVTIWAGVFPIVVSMWAAIALTAYLLCQFLILNYSRKRKHTFPLWFNWVANNILWWTFVKACWRAAASTCGQTITFKTTLKGTGRLANSNLGDLWIHVISFLALLASFGFGLWKVCTGPTVITTLSISLVWTVYAMVPPYLLLHYTYIGTGTTLRLACKIGYILTILAGICAIILLWLVYPQQYDYNRVMKDTFFFTDSQQVGTLPANFEVPWRASAFANPPNVSKPNFGKITGGWITNGNVGTLQVTLPTAFAVTMMAWSLLEFPNSYVKSNTTLKAQSTLRTGTDYLQKLYTRDTAHGGYVGTGNNRVSYNDYYIVYQIGNYTADKSWWGRLDTYNLPRPVYYNTTINGMADVAAQISAALTASAMVIQETNPKQYNSLMADAVNLYAAASLNEKNRATYSATFNYPCAVNLQTNAAPATGCKPVDQYFNGSAVGFYNSTSVYDDLAWAATWLYKATNDPGYLSDAEKWHTQHQSSVESVLDSAYTFNWNDLTFANGLLLAEATDQMQYHYYIQQYLQRWVCTSGGKIAYTANGRAVNSQDPSFAQTMNAAFLAMVYGQKIQYAKSPLPYQATTPFMDEAKSQRYICWTRTQVRYMLGGNTLAGRSFVGGFGHSPPSRIHDYGASCQSAPASCTFLEALYNPDPNPHVLYGAMVNGPDYKDGDFFTDARAGTNDTYVALDWNVGFQGAVAGLNQASGSYDQCLQGFGIFTQDTAICAGAISAS